MRAAGGGYRRQLERIDRRAVMVWVAAVPILFILGWVAGGMNLDSHQAFKFGIVLVGVALAVRAISRPGIAVYASLVAACFEQQVHFHGYTVGTVELALIVFAPALIKQWAATPMAPKAFRFGAGMLLLGSAFTILWAQDTPNAFWGLIRWALVLNLGAAIIGRLRLGGQREADRLVITITALGGIVAFFAYRQQHGSYFIVGPPYLPDRIDSTFGYYTVFAGFIGLAAVVSAGLLATSITTRRPKLVLFAAACLGLELYAAGIALSRGGVLVIAVGLPLLVLARLTRPARLVQAVLALGALLTIGYALVPAETLQQFQSRFLEQQGGDTVRNSLHAAGQAVVTSNPGGIGYDNFREFVASGTVVADAALAHAHSLFLQVAMDAGWLGFLGFATLCAAALLRATKRSLATGGSAPAVIFAAALAGALAQGINDYLFYELGYMAIFVAVVAGALAAGSGPEVTDEVEQADQPDREQHVLV